jgi:hypothetical protein
MGGIPGAIEAGVNGSGTGIMGTMGDMASGYMGGNSAQGMSALGEQAGISNSGMQGLSGLLKSKSGGGQGGGKGGGGGGGGGGGDLAMVGQLLSKSKNSGQKAGTPTDLGQMMGSGIQGYVDSSALGADETPDAQGFMRQIMGSR